MTIDDRYEEVLASIRSRFEALTSDAASPPRLFTTDVPQLYPLYLDALPPELRQICTCSACRKFTERHGGLVRVETTGKATPLFWDPDKAPPLYKGAITALAEAVAKAPITGVFLSSERVWGTPRTGEWEHFAVTPPEGLVHTPSLVKSLSQAMAEKKQDHETLLRGLEAFPSELVKKAQALLQSESLYRSEACLGVAKWLLALHKSRAGARNTRARDNLTWLAVATAPAGFCHVRSTMIGTLLEDLAADLPYDQVKTRFAAKMHPLQYQRPQAAPTAGNIARAEKVVAALQSAGALERRFARLDDIQPLWLPGGRAARARSSPESPGVFSHLKEKASPAKTAIDMPPVTMTWEKFARTVLPECAEIDFVVPAEKAPYVALVTAKNPTAPPIFQWDRADKRNPVSLYVYHGGSPPEQWNLKPATHHPVTAITLEPWMWEPSSKLDHHGAGVIFVLKGARDTTHKSGGGFFPSYLKSEYHEIRSTMEAYANSAVIADRDEAEACGIVLTKGATWNRSFRVTTNDGVRMTYNLDRWD